MDRLVPSPSSYRFTGDSTRALDPDLSPLTVGRAAGNTLAIPDPDMSRWHAVLELRGAGWVLTDVSTYGTHLRRRHRPEKLMKGTSVTLRPGDRLRMGSTELVFMSAAAEALDDDLTSPPPDLVHLPPKKYATMMELSRPLREGTGTVPASNAVIALALEISEEALRQHLKVLYELFDIPATGLTHTQRRAALANQWPRARLKGSGTAEG